MGNDLPVRVWSEVEFKSYGSWFCITFIDLMVLCVTWKKILVSWLWLLLSSALITLKSSLVLASSISSSVDWFQEYSSWKHPNLDDFSRTQLLVHGFSSCIIPFSFKMAVPFFLTTALLGYLLFSVILSDIERCCLVSTTQ